MMLNLLVPGLMSVVACIALAGKKDVYTLLITGAADGLSMLKNIVPALIILLSAVHMLRASGAMDLLTRLLTPICKIIGIPPETVPLVLIRPISGSAALAIGSDIMSTYGVNSDIGRTAAIMLGSTETTFYTISVYFGAAGVKKTRYAIPAALVADLTGFCMASVTAKLFF
jgi:spore maturation protein B